MSRETESNIRAVNTGIRRGLRKYYPTQAITLDGAQWTTARIIAAFDAEEEQFKVVYANRAQWLFAVRTLHDMIAANHRLRLAIRSAVEVLHGRESGELRHFGFRPRTRKKPSIPTMELAVEKRRATRAARKTMGRRQRAKIKGKPAG